jgi:hypothetical protein
MFALGEALMGIEGVHSAKIVGEAEPHTPPVDKEWAETRKRELQARRTELGISTGGLSFGR